MDDNNVRACNNCYYGIFPIPKVCYKCDFKNNEMPSNWKMKEIKKDGVHMSEVYVKSCDNCKNGSLPMTEICNRCYIQGYTPSNWEELDKVKVDKTWLKLFFEWVGIMGLLILDFLILGISLYIIVKVVFG
jgi:hypothetical protein